MKITRFFPFLFFFAVLLFPAAAQEKKPAVESVDITPNPVGKGDVFTLTIVVDHDNSDEIEFPLDDLPEQLQLWRGPYIRSFVETDRENNSRRKVRITATFKSRNSGRMIIPELSVTVQGRNLKTKPQLLRVGLYKSRQLYMPLEVEWRTDFSEIYTGEAVPVFLDVKNQEAVTLFERVRVAYPRDGLFEEAKGIGEISSTEQGDIILYDIPAASYIFTGTSPGEVKIPSAGVDYEGITGWTDNLILDVKRTPEGLDSGAVGRFSFRTSIDDSRINTDGEIILTCEVEGDGNLNYLEIPEPVAENCILVSTDESSNFKESAFGYSGVKSVRRLYSVDNADEIEIVVPEFDFYDKERGIIITEAQKIFKLKAETEPEVKEQAAEKVFPFSDIPLNEQSRMSWHNYYSKPYMYVWLVPGFLFFVINLILRWKRTVLGTVLTVIISVAVFSAGSFLLPEDAVNYEGSGFSTDELYNSSLDAYRSGDLTSSLHQLRTAVYLDPVNNTYRRTLDWIEKEHGYINSVTPSVKLHPDIFYYILTASVNLFFIFIVVRKKGLGSLGSVGTILFGFIIIFSGSMIFYSDSSRSKLTGICLTGSSIKKIPRESAAVWMPVNEGTAVKIIEETEGYFLIETGLGVKGWIDEDSVSEDRSGNG